MATRPMARVNVVEACRRQAIAEGKTLEECIYLMMRGLMLEGAKGNVQAARLVLYYCAQTDEHGHPAAPVTNFNFDQRSVNVQGQPTGNGGALPPPPAVFAKTLVEMREFAEELATRNPRLFIDAAKGAEIDFVMS